MIYTASEKLEIIRIVEQAHLSVTRTLDKLGNHDDVTGQRGLACWSVTGAVDMERA